MQTHLKKRIDLIIEMPLLRRVTERFDQAGVSGYSVLPVIAGRGLQHGRKYLTTGLGIFAVVMPLIGASMAAALSFAIGLSPGGTAVLMTLAASASYIAVPAALRLALPEANPAISLTMSLGVTFPVNLLLGIPLYIAVANAIATAH